MALAALPGCPHAATSELVWSADCSAVGVGQISTSAEWIVLTNPIAIPRDPVEETTSEIVEFTIDMEREFIEGGYGPYIRVGDRMTGFLVRRDGLRFVLVEHQPSELPPGEMIYFQRGPNPATRNACATQMIFDPSVIPITTR